MAKPKAITTSTAPRWNPWPYQKRAMKWVLEHPQAALFLDPGLGKSSITLGAFKVLKAQQLTKGMLVVAPLRVALSVWPQEVKGWADFADLSVGVLHGPNKLKVSHEKHDLFLINYEGLAWLIKDGGLSRMLRDGLIDMLVFDELSRMKNPAAKRFKDLRPYLPKFRRRLGLTGSPAANGLMDLFGQSFVLDCGARLGNYITHFRANYFVPKGPYDWRPKPGSSDAINAKLADLALRMEATDYLDLPPKVDNIIRVDLPASSAAVYRQLEDELVAELNGSTVTAATAAALSGKCRQLANGALYEDPADPITGIVKTGPRGWHHVHDAKLDALSDLVEELQGTPLLVGYEFKHDLARLLERFPDTPFIGGGVTPKRAAEIEAAWNRGEIPLLFGHPASMGHGLNLQKGGASNVAWFSLPWDFELKDQFERRILRQGTAAKMVVVHMLIARDTVDEAVMHALRGKEKTQKALLDALKSTVRKR